MCDVLLPVGQLSTQILGGGRLGHNFEDVLTNREVYVEVPWFWTYHVEKWNDIEIQESKINFLKYVSLN
jgi:hypothetical protein